MPWGSRVAHSRTCRAASFRGPNTDVPLGDRDERALLPPEGLEFSRNLDTPKRLCQTHNHMCHGLSRWGPGSGNQEESSNTKDSVRPLSLQG